MQFTMGRATRHRGPSNIAIRVLTKILIDIHFCGICHTDIHQARNEWGNAA